MGKACLEEGTASAQARRPENLPVFREAWAKRVWQLGKAFLILKTGDSLPSGVQRSSEQSPLSPPQP